MSKYLYFFLLLFGFASCHETVKNKSDEIKDDKIDEKPHIADTSVTKIEGLDLFIDYMNHEDFTMDTIRLSKVWAWKEASKCQKEILNDRIQINFPFPVEEYRKYLSEPATYFWVKKNPADSTNNNGLDFLLLTYKIDSLGIKIEHEIYRSLSTYYMNFPTYCIRKNSKIYILTNRMTVQDEVTVKFAKILRDFIDPKSVLYGHYGMDTIQ